MADIRGLLMRLGMGSLAANFSEQRIDSVEICKMLTDQELITLGLSKMGDRAQFRDMLNKPPDQETLHSEPTPERLNLFRPSRSRQTPYQRRPTKGKTWTAGFLCLADTNKTSVPSASEKMALQQAGLGFKKISFQATDLEADVHRKLLSEDGFPKLSTAGGFELLFCQGNSRQLKPINIKWDVNLLKSSLGPQSKLYIRPIQNDISVAYDRESDINTSEIEYKCHICNNDFSVLELRQHIAQCMESRNDEEPAADDRSSNQNVLSFTESAATTEQFPSFTESAATTEEFPSFTESAATTEQFPSFTESAATTEEFPSFTESAATTEFPNIDEVASKCVQHCAENNITELSYVVRFLQKKIVMGRNLEVEQENVLLEGETNLIMVDRANLLETAFEELRACENLRLTLEVQFYGEAAVDLGGPRKEFFSLILKEIKRKYFEPVKEWAEADYEVVGKIFALSILQNGPLPRIMSSELVEELFGSSPRPFMMQLRRGLDCLGLFMVCEKMPHLRHLFTPVDQPPLTLRKLNGLLKPQFSVDGSNRRRVEGTVYAKFVRYLRETASGRRGNITLSSVLQFLTGIEEEPLLGFTIPPSLHFVESATFLPTANTCINRLNLVIPSTESQMPEEKVLFNMFDLAFSASFFGLA